MVLKVLVVVFEEAGAKGAAFVEGTELSQGFGGDAILKYSIIIGKNNIYLSITKYLDGKITFKQIIIQNKKNGVEIVSLLCY